MSDRTFKFLIAVDYEDGDEVQWPKELAMKLAGLVKQMKGLRNFSFMVPKDCVETFAKDFRNAEIMLPRVQALRLGPFCEFIIAMCPNIQMFQANGLTTLEDVEDDTHQLIRAAKKATKLTHLELYDSLTVQLCQGKGGGPRARGKGGPACRRYGLLTIILKSRF